MTKPSDDVARYRLTNRATLDLEEIQRFIIVDKDNPSGVEVVESYLFEAFDKIGDDSARCGGRSRPEITSLPYKFLSVRKYVVVYDDRASPVRIMAILGARQNLPAIIARDPRFLEDNDE